MSESRCFAVRLSDKKTIIGFILIYGLDAGTAHIAYFLGENYWKQGDATEFLNALVAWYKENTKIAKLIAGIGADNISSVQLLKGTGFIKCVNENKDTLYYEYLFMDND